jgi:hypothetical protein
MTAAVVITVSSVSAQLIRREKPHDTCSREYKPVCTRTREGVLSTFTNECLAKASGAAILLKGRCDDDLKCPPVELPVCARKNGKNRNFTNACVAEKAGAVVLMRDQCPERCTPGDSPVCAVNERGTRENYSSLCEAVMQGARFLHRGKCLAASNCGIRGLRVCAISANGIETQYASLCDAELANAAWLHNGACKPGIVRRMLQRYGIVKPRQ